MPGSPRSRRRSSPGSPFARVGKTGSSPARSVRPRSLAGTHDRERRDPRRFESQRGAAKRRGAPAAGGEKVQFGGLEPSLGAEGDRDVGDRAGGAQRRASGGENEARRRAAPRHRLRSEEHTSELQ